MERQNSFAENEEEDQQYLNEKNPQKDLLKKDFNTVKMERIIKLQKILNKNVKLRQFEHETKEKTKYELFDLKRRNQKKSLPFIKTNRQFEQQIHSQQIQKNNLFSGENIHEQSSLKKYQQTVIFNNQHIRTLIKYEPQTKILEQNPQSQEKQGRRSFFKLKVKNLQIKEPKNLQDLLKSSKIKSPTSKNLLEKSSSNERLTVEKQKISLQKEERMDLRRKRRNASPLNLTKIQHLPQIIFPKNKKCSKHKFPCFSTAQIDTNLLRNEISEMEQTRLIEAKNREIKDRMLKQKIKANRNQFLQFINQ